MIDKHLIEKKLRGIEGFLREIEVAEAPVDFDSFSKNIIFKRFVERNIELAIEQMTDICKHFISGLDLQEPETYAECFEIIGRSGILEAESVDTFQSMARYRNLLIHAYDGVDDTITYASIVSVLTIFVYSRVRSETIWRRNDIPMFSPAEATRFEIGCE